MSQGDGLIEAGIIKRGGANYPLWLNNIGLEPAQTSVADDSIKITGADGNDLLSSNVGNISLPSTTSGIMANFRATADVTIDLTGAHWAFGTNGDLTDQFLYTYAINDNGTLKWGVAKKGVISRILDTNSSATQTDIDDRHKMLVNTALTAGTWPCRVMGRFQANFDDTGGSSEDLWTVQTGTNQIILDPKQVAPEFRAINSTGATTWHWHGGPIFVIAQGGGGGGGGVDAAGAGGSNAVCAGGGGGGGCAKKLITSGINATETVTVGAGGAGGAGSSASNGDNGVDTTFGSHITGGGGTGGNGSSSAISGDGRGAAGGAGGTATGGDTNFTGERGGTGLNFGGQVEIVNGNGGNSASGAGGGYVGKNATGRSGNKGGGGSGAGAAGSTTDRNGGTGGAGYSWIWEYP